MALGFAAVSCPFSVSASFSPRGGAASSELVTPGLTEKGKAVFTAPVPGTITLSFSNSHSYFRSKTVHLRVLPGLGPVEASIRGKSP